MSWTIKKAERQRIDAFELEKALENPLDCKEIQSVHPEGEQTFVSNMGGISEWKTAKYKCVSMFSLGRILLFICMNILLCDIL